MNNGSSRLAPAFASRVSGEKITNEFNVVHAQIGTLVDFYYFRRMLVVYYLLSTW